MSGIHGRTCVRADVETPAGWNLANCTGLNIERTALSLNAIQSLAIAINSSAGLRSLRLRQTGIGDDGAVVLAGVLRSQGTALDVIEIWRSEVGPGGCQALAEALSVRRILRQLDLRFNECGDQGAIALAAALSDADEPLQVLRLQNNGIGPSGGEALANALSTNQV